MKILSPLSLVSASIFLAISLGAIAEERPNLSSNNFPKVLSTLRRTSHFQIYTDLDSNSLDYYEQVFEGFFDYFNKHYFVINQTRPLKVYLFKDTSSYKPYAKKVWRGEYTPYGFYRGLKENTIVVNRDSGLGTATHELVHHFIATSFAKEPPTWVEEGIAAFFEKFIGHLDESGKLTISFGYFSNWRFPITKKKVDTLSIRKLMLSRDTDLCAARSFMLFLHKKKLFETFVKQIKVRTDDPVGSITLKQVYGKSLSEIEQDWKNWIRSQPIDDNVKLVKWAFVKTKKEWENWWESNKDRLYWSEDEQIYRVKN